MKNDLLRAARKGRAWTQEELAELVGVSTRTIIRWEKGEAIPQPFYRCKLCEVLRLPSEKLGVKLDMESEEKIEPPEQGQREIPDPALKPEHPSTYFVQDRSSVEEMERLKVQDGLFTRLMGGLLPEQHDTTIFHQIVDVGCGTGGWLIELAKAYPTMTRLVGVDVSATMLSYEPR